MSGQHNMEWAAGPTCFAQAEGTVPALGGAPLQDDNALEQLLHMFMQQQQAAMSDDGDAMTSDSFLLPVLDPGVIDGQRQQAQQTQQQQQQQAQQAQQQHMPQQPVLPVAMQQQRTVARNGSLPGRQQLTRLDGTSSMPPIVSATGVPVYKPAVPVLVGQALSQAPDGTLGGMSTGSTSSASEQGTFSMPQHSKPQQGLLDEQQRQQQQLLEEQQRQHLLLQQQHRLLQRQRQQQQQLQLPQQQKQQQQHMQLLLRQQNEIVLQSAAWQQQLQQQPRQPQPNGVATLPSTTLDGRPNSAVAAMGGMQPGMAWNQAAALGWQGNVAGAGAMAAAAGSGLCASLLMPQGLVGVAGAASPGRGDGDEGEEAEGTGSAGLGGPSVQEKNRTAQRRCRQRQKQKLSELEARKDALSRQLARTRNENDNLRNMNSVLEKVLTLRDEHIVRLQEAVQVFDSAAATSAAATSAASAAPCTQRSSNGAHASGSPSLSSASAPNPNSNLPPPPRPDSPPRFHMPNPAGKYTADYVRDMMPAHISNDWRDCVLRLAAVLVGVDGPAPQPSPATLRQIEAITVEMGGMCERAAMYKPALVRHLMCTNCETLQRAGADPAFWRKVVQGLYLTQTQRDDLLQARARFVQAIAAVLHERGQAAAALAVASSPNVTCHVELAAAAMDAAAAVERLREVQLKEHSCQMEFILFLFKRVLSNLQNARIFCLSYPLYPDPLALANVVLEEEQQRLADEALLNSAGA